jgi:putative transposase
LFQQNAFQEGFQALAQNTVFHQVIKLIPRTLFSRWVADSAADRGLRTLDTWTWFGALLFGQLTGQDSIRAIERVFDKNDGTMKKLGFGRVRRSTLADANAVRSLAVLEQTYEFLLARAAAVAPKNTGFRFRGDVFAMDSTTIELCLGLCPWARFHHGKGAAKLHTAIDIAGDLPQFAVITDGRTHDITVAREISLGFKPGDTLLIDRGYVDYEWLSSLTQNKVNFVTRTKANCRFKVLECRKTNRTRGFMADQIISLSSPRGGRYQGRLRRVSYREPDTGKWLVFLTNNFELATSTICALYKARWKVELFFKTIKQNLKIKKFLGTSVNAVKSQVLVALIAYLLIQLLRLSNGTSISIPDAMAVIGIMLLMKEPISRIMGDLPRTTRHPPPLQLKFPL